MAQNLLKKGHRLVVYDVMESAVKTAVATGAVKADSPSQVSSQADTVITMLPAKTHVLECYNGEQGILRLVYSSTVIIAAPYSILNHFIY